MRWRGGAHAVVAALLGVVVARADGEGALVQVGASSASVEEVAWRLRALGDERGSAATGKDGAALRALVEDLVGSELRFAEEARSRGLDRGPALRWDLDNILSRVLEERLTAELPPIAESALEARYQQERRHFERPQRILLWRIRLPSEERAREVLAELGTVPTLAAWDAATRAHSTDAATAMRRGELGFVDAEGHTEKPTVRVDPGLYAAAEPLADGELAKAPVAEAGAFGVLWRRGSTPALRLSLDQVRDELAALVTRDRLLESLAALSARLRGAQLHEVHPELLAELPVDATPSEPLDSSPPSRSAEALGSPGAASATAVDPTPRPGPAGLR